jgi:hypothetical protein
MMERTSIGLESGDLTRQRDPGMAAGLSRLGDTHLPDVADTVVRRGSHT